MPCEEVALGELAGQAMADLAPLIAERGVEIEVAADLPVVCIDRVRSPGFVVGVVRCIRFALLRRDLAQSRRNQALAAPPHPRSGVGPSRATGGGSR